MGQILDIRDYMQEEEPDLHAMNALELETYLAQLRVQIAALDAQEPEDMESEAYEEWGDAHEELEDLVDEVLDLLEARQ